MPARDVPNANENLLAAEKTLNSNLIALGIWDNTTYPFEQSMLKFAALNAAVSALQSDPVGYDDALAALDGVGLTWYGTSFSYPVFLQNLRQREPDYYRANMAALGRMPLLLDVIPETATRCAPHGPRRRCPPRRSSVSRRRSRPRRPTSRAA